MWNQIKKMATTKKRQNSDLLCKICEKRFRYLSKYKRHLESASHLRFEESLSIGFRESEQSESTLGSFQLDAATEFGALDGGADHDEFSDYESINELSDDEIEEENVFNEFEFDISSDDEYYPFESRVHALAFMLINGPRPMGEENLRFIFQIFQLPSYSSLKNLTLPGFIEPTKHYTLKKIPFYINKPSDILRRCLSVPDIATNIARFPVWTQSELKEIYQGDRWFNDERFYTPMITSAHGDIFVGDFVKCIIGGHQQLGKINRFYMKELFSEIYIDVTLLQETEGVYLISTVTTITVSDIVATESAPSCIMKWNETSSTYRPLTERDYQSFTAAHRLKQAALGRPVVMLPIVLFTDDTSGNRSKQWNKFDSWSLRIAGLPNKYNSKLQNIHLLCCSNKCDVMEMSKPLVDDLINLESSGIVAYDAYLDCDVLLVAPVICILADNPRHSQIMNHLGSSAKKYCRICMATSDDKSIELSLLRNKSQTLQVIMDIRSKRTEKDKSACRAMSGISCENNPFLDLPLDLHRSTPVEMLHTVLLGPYKYLLRKLMSRLSAKERDEVQSILSAFNFSGFKIKLGTKISKHYKSFVGRDFKALAQCALFIFKRYFTDEEMAVWLALSKVFKLTYCDLFLRKDEMKCRDICKAFVKEVYACYPEFGKKVKIHLILHLADCMLEYGPTCGFNTERFEAFNSLIRSKNIYSNRLAPSRDIATRFEVIGYLRSLCDGGGLMDDGFRAGKGLRDLYRLPAVQAYLNGLTPKELHFDKELYQHATLRKLACKKEILGDVSISLMDYGDMKLKEIRKAPGLTLLSEVELDTCVSVHNGLMSDTMTMIRTGDFVKYSDGTVQVDSIGQLLTCFKERGNSYCVVRPLQYMDVNGEWICNAFDCPFLSFTNLVYCIPSISVKMAVSVVHECSNTCTFTTTSASKRIEHETVSVRELTYKHDWSNNLFCYNVYCMC